MSELTRLRDEAERLLTTYAEHRNSEDPKIRHKVHVELDRFLMHNREMAAMMMLSGLDTEVERRRAELHLEYEKQLSLWDRLRRRLRLKHDLDPAQSAPLVDTQDQTKTEPRLS